jgi:hypothetical protein
MLINLRRLLIAVLLTALTSTVLAAETGPRVHNLAPTFLEFWSGVESQPAAERVQRLKTEVFPTFPEFYEYKVGKWRAAGRDPDAALANELEAFPAIRESFAKKTLEISRDLKATIASFVKALPDLDRNFDVYVIHSLNDMDGGTRQIGGKTYFILGIDGMVKYHQGASSEVPFFHHELFHMYHGQYLAETEQIWLALWMEGLATYASQKLNPGATYQDMLLDLPAGMVPAIDSRLAWHWKHLSARLDSTDPADYATYFQNSSKQSDVVGRAGYYLGYKVAAEVGKTMSLSQMAQLKAADVYPLVKATVQKLSRRAGNDD